MLMTTAQTSLEGVAVEEKHVTGDILSKTSLTNLAQKFKSNFNSTAYEPNPKSSSMKPF